MSADVLRRAAALMRERAEVATNGPWVAVREPGLGYVVEAGRSWPAIAGDEEDAGADAEHIASWHPAVALAVADWLEVTANDVEHVHSTVYNLTSTTVARAFTVARAYLGESA